MAILLPGRAAFPSALTAHVTGITHLSLRKQTGTVRCRRQARTVCAKCGPTKPDWVRCALLAWKHSTLSSGCCCFEHAAKLCSTSLRTRRVYEEDAEHDPDIAALLQGTRGDPDLIRKRIDEDMRNKHRQIMSGQGTEAGQQQQMQVRFRQVDLFDLWLWLELYRAPSPQEQQLLEEVLSSWFMLGRLGGFNGLNLQVFYKGSDDSSYMDYDAEECESALQAFFHDMTSLEMQGCWCRCWVNMGTADELALDILINSLSNFSRENVGIKQLVVGGVNEDWAVPTQQTPKVTMDPLRAPADMDMDDLDY